jgi:HEAT repeat protein
LLALFQVRPDEVRKARLLILLMLISSAGGGIASPGVDALFFTRFGVEFLPSMYIALGAVTVVSSLVMTALLGRLPKRRLYQWLPLLLGIALAASRILVGMRLTWFYAVLWLLMYLVWTVQFLILWGLGSMVFDTRQGKRLFPLIAAGGILGTALGGLATKPLVGLVGAENLLLAWSAAFMIDVYLIYQLQADLVEQRTQLRSGQTSMLYELQRGYRFVRQSELMRWMAVGALLFGLLLFAVLFPFSKAVADTFPNEDEIAGFLGIFQGLTTVIAFLTSLLFANRLFARVGFLGALLVFPVVYLVGFASIAVMPVFAAFAAFRFGQLVWRLGVADSAFQSVFGVVPPDEREHTRAFIDGIPRQAGVALAGALLLLSERVLAPIQSFLIGGMISTLCVYVIWRGRSAYRSALAQALRSGRPDVFHSEREPFSGFKHDAAAVRIAVDGMSDADPGIRRVAAEILGNLRLPKATQALVAALDDPDPEMRAVLLRSLARTNDSSALLDVAAHLGDPEPSVRLETAAAMHRLAGYSKGLRTFMEGLLSDSAPEVRSAAAVIMLQTGPHDLASRVLDDLKNAHEPEARVVVLEALARWGGLLSFEFASSCLPDSHPSVRRAAVSALARTDDVKCLPLLIETLADEDRLVRETVTREIKRFGETALQPVIDALQSPDKEEGALRALHRLPFRRSLAQLQAYASTKREMALYYDELWRGLVNYEVGDDALDLLADTLLSASRRESLRAIRAIGLYLGSDSAFVAIENLESKDRAQRANALEILDSLGERDIVHPLLRVWDDAEDDPATLDDTIAAVEQALRDIDPWVRASAALAAGEFGDSQFKDQLEVLEQSDPDLIVRETARRSLEGGAMKVHPTLSMMERILFLRRVPLFADLPPSELKQVAAIAYEHLYSEDELIARQGEMGDEMYIIVDGDVRVLAEPDVGTSEELARRGPGEYVGEMAIISHEPRMASLRAVGDVRMLCIGQKEFEGIIRERPETSLAVIHELIERLKQAQSAETP